MKNKLFLLFGYLFLVGCGQNHLSHMQVTSNYFNARNAMDFEEIKATISDSIIITEGDYVMPYTHHSFYEVFKWDSVFQTTYEIIDLKEINDQIIATVALNSIRNKFLKNEPMTCQFKLSFIAKKISKIESLDCEDADWEVWQKGVNELVIWIDANHPDLNGFIHDMTMYGAQNYLKAIELYELKESK